MSIFTHSNRVLHGSVTTKGHSRFLRHVLVPWEIFQFFINFLAYFVRPYQAYFSLIQHMILLKPRCKYTFCYGMYVSSSYGVVVMFWQIYQQISCQKNQDKHFKNRKADVVFDTTKRRENFLTFKGLKNRFIFFAEYFLFLMVLWN